MILSRRVLLLPGLMILITGGVQNASKAIPGLSSLTYELSSALSMV